MLKIVFMGTPEFSVPALEACIREHKVVGVYTQPDRPVGRGQKLTPPPVKAAALKHSIPVFQPEKLSEPGVFENLQSLAPDVIVVVAYGQLLKKNVLTLPRFGCVNIHASLLPRWRGAAPIHWALMSGDKETGVGIMKMEEGLDTGPVYLEKKIPITEGDTVSTLHDGLSALGADALLEVLAGFEKGKTDSVVQPAAGATYAKKLDKDMQWLSSSMTAREAWLRIRALNPWPGTSVKVNGERLKIVAAKKGPTLNVKPGQIVLDRGMLLLGFSDGPVELVELQWEGKKAVVASEFVNGLQGRGLHLPLMIS